MVWPNAFREVIHGLFTFSFLSLLAVHLLHGRRFTLYEVYYVYFWCILDKVLIIFPQKFLRIFFKFVSRYFQKWSQLIFIKFKKFCHSFLEISLKS